MKPRTHAHASSRALSNSLALINTFALMKTLALASATTFALALFTHASAPACLAQSQTQTQSAARPAGAAGVERSAGERGSGVITGRVVGESGEPLTGALVYVSRRATVPQLSNTQRVATDEEGNFKVTGLDPGLYNVFANIPGYVTDTDFLTGRPAAYRPGDTVSLRLVKGGVITGTVTDTQGEVIVGIGVRAYRVRDLDGRPASFGYNPGVEDRTDDRGVYRIFGLERV